MKKPLILTQQQVDKIYNTGYKDGLKAALDIVGAAVPETAKKKIKEKSHAKEV